MYHEFPCGASFWMFLFSVDRKRVTPPSVRFLGRKVYLFAVVVLVSAMRQGPTPRRVALPK